LVARLGGEEFAVLFHDTKADRVFERLESFRKELASEAMVFGDDRVDVTVSIGCTFQPEQSLDAMMKRADKKLYLAKKQGRNQVCHD